MVQKYQNLPSNQISPSLYEYLAEQAIDVIVLINSVRPW